MKQWEISVARLKAEVLKLKLQRKSDDPDERLFSSASVYLRKMWEAARKEAGVPSLRFDDLRHTFATRMADAGMEMQEVAKILGHTDISMTYRYYPNEEGERQDEGHPQQTCSDVGEMAELRDFIGVEILRWRRTIPTLTILRRSLALVWS
jgi:integrase